MCITHGAEEDLRMLDIPVLHEQAHQCAQFGLQHAWHFAH